MKLILMALTIMLTACATEVPIPGVDDDPDEFEKFEQMESGNMNIKLYVRKSYVKKRAPAGAKQKDEK